MKVVTLFRPTKNPNGAGLLKGHIAHRDLSGSVRPICGGGPGGKNITAWDVDYLGLESVSCRRCIKRAAKFVERAKKKQCIYCGCSEEKACVVRGVPCHWAIKQPPVCSACSIPVSRNQTPTAGSSALSRSNLPPAAT